MWPIHVKDLREYPYCFWGDWHWPSRSNLTSKSKFTPFWACPRDNSPVQARATKFGPEVLYTLVKIPVGLAVDWASHHVNDMSNLIYFQYPVYLHHLTSLKYLWDLQQTDETESVSHPKWLRTYMFAHRVASWTAEESGCIFSATIAGFPVLDSAIGNGFLHVSVCFRQIKHTILRRR